MVHPMLPNLTTAPEWTAYRSPVCRTVDPEGPSITVCSNDTATLRNSAPSKDAAAFQRLIFAACSQKQSMQHLCMAGLLGKGLLQNAWVDSAGDLTYLTLIVG